MAKLNKQGWLTRVLLMSLVLSISLAMGASISWAIVVDDPGDPTATTGTTTLRDAIIAANGDTGPTPITFDPTVFPATIFLTSQLPNLTDPGDTIDGSGNGVILDGSALVGNRDGIRVRASNITIRGLTIRDFPRDGMRIQPDLGGNRTVTGVVITKNVFKGNLDGLRVSGGDGPDNAVGVTIANNDFIENMDDGIFVNGSFGGSADGGNEVKVVINNNLIQDSQGVDTGGTTTGDGIRVIGGGGSSGQGVNGGNKVIAIISNNDVKDNVDDGILVAGTGNGDASNHTVFTKIVANKVKNSGAPSATGGHGIVIRGGSIDSANPPGSGNMVTFLIANNKSETSKDRGITVSGGFGDSHTVSGTISDNNVKGSGLTGINLSGCCGNNTLEDINILDNKVINSREGDGIRVTGGSGGNATLSNITIKGNRSERNGRHGILVSLGSGARNTVSVTGVTDNEANKNDRDGILVGTGVSGSGATPISGNEANKNKEDGIDLNDTGYVVLANEAKKNNVDGINAVGNIDGGGNTATGNASCNTPGCF